MDHLAIEQQKNIAQAAGVVTTICVYTLFVYRRAGSRPLVTYGP